MANHDSVPNDPGDVTLSVGIPLEDVLAENTEFVPSIQRNLVLTARRAADSIYQGDRHVGTNNRWLYDHYALRHPGHND